MVWARIPQVPDHRISSFNRGAASRGASHRSPIVPKRFTIKTGTPKHRQPFVVQPVTPPRRRPSLVAAQLRSGQCIATPTHRCRSTNKTVNKPYGVNPCPKFQNNSSKLASTWTRHPQKRGLLHKGTGRDGASPDGRQTRRKHRPIPSRRTRR